MEIIRYGKVNEIILLCLKRILQPLLDGSMKIILLCLKRILPPLAAIGYPLVFSNVIIQLNDAASIALMELNPMNKHLTSMEFIDYNTDTATTAETLQTFHKSILKSNRDKNMLVFYFSFKVKTNNLKKATYLQPTNIQ